ncbi:MAG: winged helix-turn-helix transcriptional regulator [Thermomicrobiales bacterium]|nr:winged helix-turn-helix transcriptional regulator [Thermomicrobiales bacterium]
MEPAAPALHDVPQAVFESLVDPTRRAMIERLSSADEPVSISELADGFSISRQAVTKHLTNLEKAGLVRAERRGRERLLTLSPEPLDAATAWIATIEARWDARLAALQRFLAETPEE